MPNTIFNNALALDVGGKRIGLAVASSAAKLPRKLGVINVDGSELDQLKSIIKDEGVDLLIVGLPRTLRGSDSEQTRATRNFVDRLQSLGLEIQLQDEAGTSKKAEEELRQRKKTYSKEDVDSLAAVYILEDYLRRV